MESNEGQARTGQRQEVRRTQADRQCEPKQNIRVWRVSWMRSQSSLLGNTNFNPQISLQSFPDLSLQKCLLQCFHSASSIQLLVLGLESRSHGTSGAPSSSQGQKEFRPECKGTETSVIP